MKRQLGYLSGAPRVSTRSEAAASGPRAHVLGIVEAFERLGWDVKRFIVGDRVPPSWVSQEAEHALHRSYLRRLAADLVRIGICMANGRRAVRELMPVDWVYERFAAFQALGKWFRRQGVPWILETNGLFYKEAASDRLTLALPQVERYLEKQAYHAADVVVCVSESLKKLLIEEVNLNPEKIIVVPNGVDVQRFNPATVRPIRVFPSPVIGFVGTLHSWQGVDTLIRAVAEVEREGVKYSVVIVGDGPMRVEWEKLARTLGVANSVRFMGRMPWDQIPSYIAGFDLTYSGHVPLTVGTMYHSPLKLYEYMAMGKPVVAAEFTDAKRLIRESETGYLFDPGNVDDLKRTLWRAYAEREAWPRMGKRARAEIVAKHSWEARISEMIPKIEAILEDKYGTAYPTRRTS
ncbi:glycosyltransferase family 4 protein [Thermaerobacter litoralis]